MSFLRTASKTVQRQSARRCCQCEAELVFPKNGGQSHSYRDDLSAIYAPVPIAEVAEFLTTLEKLEVIEAGR